MTINIERAFEIVTLEITGRLDTATSANLDLVINELFENARELVFESTVSNTYPRQESEFC